MQNGGAAIARFAIVGLVFAAGCTKGASPDLAGVELSYSERSPNCVNCCEFEVRFRARGMATFIGQRACPIPGPQAFRLADGEFESLVQSFAAADFFGVPRLATPLLVDGNITTIAYRDHRRTHEVLYNVPPSRLKALAARLRQFARADEHLRPSLADYEALVASGWDVNTLDEHHDNALIATISAGDLASTRFLLARGARLSDEAARLAAGRPETEFLTMAETTFNAAAPRRPAGMLLPEAARTSAAHVGALLDAGADVNWRRSETTPTPLMVAIAAGSLQSAAMLLRAGAAVEARDDQERTAMSYAAVADNSGFIPMLAARGANANARDRSGRTPLMIATGGCYEWNIPALLAVGADPLIADAAGRTALQPAFSVVGDPKCSRSLRLVEAVAARPRSAPRVQ